LGVSIRDRRKYFPQKALGYRVPVSVFAAQYAEEGLTVSKYEQRVVKPGFAARRATLPQVVKTMTASTAATWPSAALAIIF